MGVRLTKRSVAGIEPPPRGYTLHWDLDLHGFGVRVTAAGARSFIVEKRIKGRTVRETLGRCDDALTPELARKRAQIWLGNVAAGLDPKAERQRAKLASTTLEDAFKDYVRLKRRSKDGKALKPRTVEDMLYSLEHAFARWKSKPLPQITSSMVQARYQQLVERSTARANIDMRYLRAVINFAADRTVDSDGRPVITYNPVKGLKGQWRSVGRRTRMMTAKDLKVWVPAVNALGEVPERPAGEGKKYPKLRHGEIFRDTLMFIALTACRLGEALALRLGDVDLAAGNLTLRDTKNRTDLALPLTEKLREILARRLADGGEFVFPVSNFRYCLERVRTTSGIEFSPHDLRRLAATAMEKGGVPAYTIKAVLNHLSGAQDVTGGYVQVDSGMKLEALAKIQQHLLQATGVDAA